MIQVVIALALCAAFLFAAAYFHSFRPTSLTARISTVNYGRDSKIFRVKLLAAITQKLSHTFTSRKNSQQVLFELPDFLELLSVAISSGETIYSALGRVIPRLNGVLASELESTLSLIHI